MDSVVGKPASFRLESGYAHLTSGGTRLWNGICSHFQQLQAVLPQRGQSALHTYHIRIVPTLWLLTQRRGHRIFQHISIPDIVKKVLDEWNIEADWKISDGDHRKLEYKVQYGADYTFVCRLLEEAGIAFAFLDPEGKGAKLTFSDALESNAPRSALPFSDNPNEQAGREFVKNVRLSREVRHGALTVRDHDFRRPAFELFGEARGAETPENSYEHYLYDPGTFLVDDARGGDTPFADARGVARHDQAYGARIAGRLLQAERTGSKTVAFETNVMDAQPGAVFSVSGHPHAALAGKPLLVTEFSIEGTHNGEWAMAGRAVFADAPFQPPRRTPKPTALGVQSATVVGPKDQEIHTDEFGRVCVQFPWDRDGQNDEGSSCWIRVSQAWAGTGFGMLVLPRIGQEVLVSFLDGDPEQPVVMGRAYNRIEPVPYKLPDDKTISVWKSDSSPGGGGFNEVKFEDRKGDELFYEQSQKNRRVFVKNNETLTVLRHRQKQVGANETDTTGANRTEVTGANRSETTGANRVTAIGGARRRLIKKDDTGRTQSDRRLRVGKDHDIRLKKKKREFVEADVHLLVKGDRRELAENNQSTAVGASRHEKVGGRFALETGKELHLSSGDILVGEAGQDLTLKGPGGFIRIDAEGVTIKGTMVYINEGGKSAGEGSGAAPEAPEPPDENEQQGSAPPMYKSKLPEERKFMEDNGVHDHFPKLGDNYEVLAPQDENYNCIAHTLGMSDSWVNPVTGPAADRLQGMDSIYGTQGYIRSSDMDFSLKPGTQKIVVYGTKNADGTIAEITHGAIQDEHGTWTSKLGQWPLIRHESPESLSGPAYGVPVAVYEK
ncbi:type IV secretion protein Rhs [Sorangium cellulosum]|nr:type IV secretion protein Rhs [Sorangium cellulosum]